MAASFSKILLKVTGPEATTVCQDGQLFAVLKAVIDSAFHGDQDIWDKNWTMEDWGLLIVETNNAFNEVNRFRMLWAVRHLWPSGARFVFNCYRHWSSLVLRKGNGTAIFLHSNESVTQGGPLAITVYGIGIL